MADAAIIEAEYVEWKMVKTRKALQLIFEVPLEHQALVQAALGTPMPDTSTPVAIARMMTAAQLNRGIEAITAPTPALEDEPHKPPRPLSQVSAILCNIVAFRRFLHEEHGFDVIPTVDEAADWVREHCGVQSRREFDTDDAAAANFRHLRNAYDAWMRCAA